MLYRSGYIPLRTLFWSIGSNLEVLVFSGIITYNEELPVILWPPEEKSQLIGKDPDAGKDWRQKEKRVAEDELLGWHCWLSGHEFDQAPGDSKGQGSLVCCSPWSCKKLVKTWQLNNTTNKKLLVNVIRHLLVNIIRHGQHISSSGAANYPF